MPTLPSANLSVTEAASTPGAGTDVVCVMAAVKQNADIVPRVFGNASALNTQHAYNEGLEYTSFHFSETRKPVIFIGLPISTLGAVGRKSTAGNTGSSVVDVTANSSGCMTAHDGVCKVASGGTIGTDQIVLDLSLDGGRLFKKVRLGTGNSYVEPFADVTLTFGAGTLVAGDTVLTWSGSSPRPSTVDIATARANLAAQMKFFRSILVVGDWDDDVQIAAIRDQISGYDTQNQRFVYARVNVKDRLPLAALSKTTARMVTGTSLTFDTSGDTITRATGSWLADGFAIGDTVVITGTASNNFTLVISNLSATVLTTTTNLVNEGPTVNATVVGFPTLTFAEAGANDTVTRNRGSWLADGFRVGDKIKITGTSLNNVTAAFGLLTVTALTLTMGNVADDFAAEVIGTHLASVVAGQTKAEWMTATVAEYATIDGTRYVDIAAGRARKASPWSGWNFARPPSWAASLREYQHDLHIATWRKSDGPTGWDLNDTSGNLECWDDRVDGGAGTSARFTTFRTWGNGPSGSFIAMSLTRASDGSILGLTNNVAVLDLAMTVCQFSTENVVGRSLTLKVDGTATTESLNTIKTEVNAALELALLKDAVGEGARASLAVWTPSASDILNVPDATINGTLDLNLNGTVVRMNTVVRVRSGGQ